MLNIDFTSYRIMQYERVHGSIYNQIALDTVHIVELLKIGTGCEDEEQVCNLLDALKKEKGGLKGVLEYLIDLLDNEGFFTYLTAHEINSLILEKLENLNRLEHMTEEERQAEKEKAITQAVEKLIKAQKKIIGTKSGKN